MNQADFFNEDRIIQFSDIDDFLINSPNEITQYINLASEARTSCDIRLYDIDRRQVLLTLSSYIFINEKKQIEFEGIFHNEVSIFQNIRQHCVIRAQMYLHGVRIVFESLLESWNKEKSTIIFKVGFPYKMVRYQRRDSFRVKIPANFTIKVDLEKGHEFLSNLPALNISGGGVAVLINASEEMVATDNIFENAQIYLPVGKYDFFNLQMRVRHQKLIDKKYLPKLMQSKITPHPWYHVGLQFGRLPPGMEQALTMMVNNLSRSNN